MTLSSTPIDNIRREGDDSNCSELPRKPNTIETRFYPRQTFVGGTDVGVDLELSFACIVTKTGKDTKRTTWVFRKTSGDGTVSTITLRNSMINSIYMNPNPIKNTPFMLIINITKTGFWHLSKSITELDADCLETSSIDLIFTFDQQSMVFVKRGNLRKGRNVLGSDGIEMLKRLSHTRIMKSGLAKKMLKKNRLEVVPQKSGKPEMIRCKLTKNVTFSL